MVDNNFVLHGDIIFPANLNDLEEFQNGYLVVKNGKVDGCFSNLPDIYRNFPIKDYKNSLIIPGLVDMHLHAPQYPLCGMNMDLELMPWLNAYIFPEEEKYKNIEYAKKTYPKFVADLKKSPTTRAVIFSTIHVNSTEYLMDLLEASGLKTMVGKVNMDRNSSDGLTENTKHSLEETIKWIELSIKKYKNVRPIITPRFVPSCTEEMLYGLGKIAKEYNIPVQSHLSENLNEISRVKKLHPKNSCYGDVYNEYGLFGNHSKTVMAHCVHSTEQELNLIKENGVYIAHCPQSNTNIKSGIAPISRYLSLNLKVGLGTDLAGGANISMFRAIADAIQVSKLLCAIVKDYKFPPLTIEQALYMATCAGGSFFGRTGCFKKGYDLDALILDDSSLGFKNELKLKQRLERVIYLADERNIIQKYVAGIPIL